MNERKIAVIGSGVAGLSAAFLLSCRDGDGSPWAKVTLFDRAPAVGMDLPVEVLRNT